MDTLKQLVITHYLAVVTAIPSVAAAGFAARHYLDSIILLSLRFFSPAKIKEIIAKAQAFLDAEIDKEAALPDIASPVQPQANADAIQAQATPKA